MKAPWMAPGIGALALLWIGQLPRVHLRTLDPVGSGGRGVDPSVRRGRLHRPYARRDRPPTALVLELPGGGRGSGDLPALRRDPLSLGDRPRNRAGEMHRGDRERARARKHAAAESSERRRARPLTTERPPPCCPTIRRLVDYLRLHATRASGASSVGRGENPEACGRAHIPGERSWRSARVRRR